ncbi:Fic family protein [Mycoplasma marinum]|uniref:Fido domain-containing protein n=1 Tax=Mycoplasma marinum TaxID=1937190 RepID=A0A4R0XNF4_9MOLU|nr:Fic family protein [Mycoplasma marinum]TCG10485.1 hypothetical protein C4B24_04580 [Mycoplasma marinum]
MKCYKTEDLLTDKNISNKLKKIFMFAYQVKDMEISANGTPFIENYKNKQNQMETKYSNAIENINEYKYSDDEWIGLNEANQYITRNYNDPLDIDELQDIHQRLMRSKKDSGELKRKDNTVAGYKTSSIKDVEKDLYQILSSYYSEEKDTLEKGVISSIIFTLNFLMCHLFQDGNGRMSRMLLHKLLIKSGLSFVKYQMLSQYIHDEKQEYYNSLEHVRKGILDNPGAFDNDNAKPYIIYILDTLIQAILDFGKQLQLFNQIGKNNTELKRWIIKEISMNKNTTRKLLNSKINLIISEDKLKRIVREMISDKEISTNGHGRVANFV